MSNEKVSLPSRPREESKNISDREVKQVTHRDLASYLNLFSLPEESLGKIESVVDVGAGFSSFSEETRKRFQSLAVTAIDPIYEAIKYNPQITPEQLETEGVLLDFDASYRGAENSTDQKARQQNQLEVFSHFLSEIRSYPDEYIAASHQNIPLADNTTDLVLASNSIIRPENTPLVIENALSESLRILKKNGELRIAGAVSCFEIEETTGAIELWYNGTLTPNGSWVKEFKQTGHYSDPDLMKVFNDIEKTGVKLYAVVASSQQNGSKKWRFDSMILRKDNERPLLRASDSDTVKIELRELHFRDSDGFTIPSDLIY